MPGGMKRYFINAIAVAIMCMENRRIRIRFDAPLDSHFAAGNAPNLIEQCHRPASAFTLHAFHQRLILRKDIVTSQRRRLIEYLMRRMRHRCYRCGACISPPNSRRAGGIYTSPLTKEQIANGASSNSNKLIKPYRVVMKYRVRDGHRLGGCQIAICHCLTQRLPQNAPPIACADPVQLWDTNGI